MTLINNKNSSILDMGTGAGLPGIVLSILGYQNITMVDSRKKKTEFVQQIIEKLGLNTKIINSRLEDMRFSPFQYITSRALASLDKLLNYSLFFEETYSTVTIDDNYYSRDVRKNDETKENSKRV